MEKKGSLYVDRRAINDWLAGKRKDPFVVYPEVTSFIKDKIGDAFVEVVATIKRFPQKEGAKTRQK